MDFPVGLDGIVATYGDYKPFLRSDYTISPAWERKILVSCWLPMPVRLGWDPTIEVFKVRVHYLLLTSIHEVLAKIARAGLWPELKTFDGGYAWRQKRDGQKLSTHCWGIALDFNAGTNPLGEVGDMHHGIVDIFEEAGWQWGGRWSRPDYMHFQAARGY